MADHAVADYGGWPSPISAADVARAGTRLGQAAWHAGRVWWVEGRPEEQGRSVVVSMARDGAPRDELPEGFDARSAVHEYGGGAFCVGEPGLAFVNAADQCVYLLSGRDAAPRRLTPAQAAASYADLQFDVRRRRIIAVREDHAATPGPAASLVSIALDPPAAVQTLTDGEDFFASPRLSPDGQSLVWLTWRHPDMPWDGTRLWRADWDTAGRLQSPCPLAGGPGESLFNPLFAPDGRLYVVSDASGWWNIGRLDAAGGFTPVLVRQADFGQPQWMFGQSTLSFDDDGQLYALFSESGFWQMARIDVDGGRLDIFDLPFTHLEQLRARGGELAFIGGSPSEAPTLCVMSASGAGLQRLRSASESVWDETLISTPQATVFPTADDDQAHALFYPPRNPRIQAPTERRPPLLIKCHGGPTGATSTALDPRIQFWTSRGFAVLDVNYRGSTGYGREYRRKLYGRWGIADVQDCEAGVRHLIREDLIDPARVVISGASAGGYTVLCVLTWSNIAAAGTSYYGIGDLKRLLAGTHKFESRYLGRLIGPDDSEYDARSPLQHAHRISCPVLFLQGGKDRVVPPDQADTMAAALRERGLAVAQVTFPEERHGFRDAANLTRALESELTFYARVLGLDVPLPATPLIIDNLD
ncbi:MAG: peptidase [Salinisphaeraceae bacterium]|nr:peptidase [Salinisphaeraceae bacterium]